MEFLENANKFYIEIGLLIVFLIGNFIVTRKDNLKLTLQYYLYSYAIAILLLATSIPYVYPGFPDTISDLENKKMLLHHLHKNSEALAETREVITQMAFLTFILMVSVVSKIIKNFKLDKSVE